MVYADHQKFDWSGYNAVGPPVFDISIVCKIEVNGNVLRR